MPGRARRWFYLVLACAASCSTAAERTEDHRAWQHGINVLQVGDQRLVVWGSAGNPPRPNLGGNWTHDIYYAWLRKDGSLSATKVLVSKPEAQEPPSVAINASGTLMMTSEDGNGGINQHAGLWDSSLNVLRKYPFRIKRGGHSGHVAAMGERFLVTYGEGWVDGGGWRGLGTGQNIFARMVEADGRRRQEIKLTPDQLRNPRDSWPLVAASDRNWLVVWQRYPEMSLQSALIGTAGIVSRRQIIDGLPLRYAYDVEYAAQIERYVVAGNTGEEGFIALIGLSGEVIRIQRGLPPMASESRIVLGWDGAQLTGAYPVDPRGVAVVRLSPDAIELVRLLDHPYAWDYAGTTGLFLTPKKILFISLSTAGLQQITIELND